MRLYAFLILLFLLGIWACENKKDVLTISTLDCSKEIDRDSEILCHYYYTYQSIWDTVLIEDSNASEVYRLQFILARTTPTFYLHSQSFIYPDGTARSIISKYSIEGDPYNVELTSRATSSYASKDITRLIQASEFWTTSSVCKHCRNTFDGDIYLLEGWKKDSYQVIYRTSLELSSKIVDDKEKVQLTILDSLFNQMMGGWPFVIVGSGDSEP